METFYNHKSWRNTPYDLDIAVTFPVAEGIPSLLAVSFLVGLFLDHRLQ